MSRRTDIPAHYASWFFNRIKDGFVCVRNPFNPRQVSRIWLSPDAVDCIVFWTKHASAQFIQKMPLLDGQGYCYYVQYTITPYGRDIEPGVPPLSEAVQTFISLSRLIGKQRMIWRYDPIFCGAGWTAERHVAEFERLAVQLSGSACRCIISFIDVYAKIRSRLAAYGIRELTEDEIHKLAYGIAHSAAQYGISVETCAESIDLMKYGIRHGHCIDGDFIASLNGIQKSFTKDQNQRPLCGCAASVDIGMYNTCAHGCVYCYAGGKFGRNIAAYDDNSPVLCSLITDNDYITDRNDNRVSYTKQLI